MAELPVNPWNVSEREFPYTGSPSDKLRFCVSYAVLAPSGHNSQPWRFGIQEDEVWLYADTSRALPVVDPLDRELIMSCGAALLFLRVAMRKFGCLGEIQVLPDSDQPDLIARIRLGKSEPASEMDLELFEAIPRRRTNRMPFEDRAVGEEILSWLEKEVRDEGAWLQVVEGEDARMAVADLIATADRLQMADQRFRRELAAWLHPNRTLKGDGLPGYAYGVGDLMSYAGPLVIRTFDLGSYRAAKDRDLATGSPALVVIGTTSDSPRDWIACGQALGRALLRARVEGVWASFLNQPIEVLDLRVRLNEILGRSGSPQLLLRLGYACEVKPTPRRRLSEVIF